MSSTSSPVLACRIMEAYFWLAPVLASVPQVDAPWEDVGAQVEAVVAKEEVVGVEAAVMDEERPQRIERVT
ncbi:hypothetical protein K439DRAFT_116036 [Ramaria rubella]|nr:hypothetical protein K439DRAFT_116036 [Ramaria rubella]